MFASKNVCHYLKSNRKKCNLLNAFLIFSFLKFPSQKKEEICLWPFENGLLKRLIIQKVYISYLAFERKMTMCKNLVVSFSQFFFCIQFKKFNISFVFFLLIICFQIATESCIIKCKQHPGRWTIGRSPEHQSYPTANDSLRWQSTEPTDSPASSCGTSKISREPICVCSSPSSYKSTAAGSVLWP